MEMRYLILKIIFIFGFILPVFGQDIYPIKPVRLIVPFPPGGGTDAVGRIVAQKLSERWGQNVLVDNRPGGDTIIGINAAAQSSPDGYTLVMLGTTFAINASRRNLPYDPIKDFDVVSNIAKSYYVLVMHPDVPANNLQELVALAKLKPGSLNYGSTGNGSTPHLCTELLSKMAGIKMQHIPYKGSGPLTIDLLSGQIQLGFNNTISAMVPLIANGKLKAVAVSSEKRIPTLPDIPTFSEAGLPGNYELLTWFSLAVPSGTPKSIIDKIAKDMSIIMASPDTIELMGRQGMEPLISTSPSQAASLVRSEIAKFSDIVKSANINFDN